MRILCGLTFAACGLACVPPTNPFDPDTPLAQQAPGSLTGTIVLDDVTAPADSLALELAAVRVVLVDATGATLKVDGQDREVPLADVDAAGGSGTFTFDELVPGKYAPQVLNVGARYTRPIVNEALVFPGAAVDVGELRFISVDAGDGGPGRIEGDVELADADGGARVVQVLRVSTDGSAPVVARSVLTDASGHFVVPGLAVGSYAVLGTLSGFTTDYKLDIEIGETGGAQLAHTFAGSSALVLHPVTAVLRPSVVPVEGTFYIAGDAVPLDVLAFGGVTSMRLSTSSSAFADDDFVPFAASASLALPVDVEGPIALFAQFKIESNGGLVSFTSDTFSSSVVRDVSAPVVIDPVLVGVDRDPVSGTFLVNAGDGADPVLRAGFQDVVSAVSGVFVVAGDGPASAAVPDDPATVPYDDVTTFGGLVSLERTAALGADGDKHVIVYARDRAGNFAEPAVVDVILDRSAPDVQLDVANATAGTLPVRTALLTFDEASALADLPVAMQIGIAPLASNAPIVPYEPDAVVVVGEADGAHGSPVQFAARLFDRAGNVALVESPVVSLSLLANIAGTVRAEGVPTIEPDAAGAVVDVVSAAGSVVGSAVSASDGSFTVTGVVEGVGHSLVASRAGYAPATLALPPVSAQAPGASPLPAGTVNLTLLRGTVVGSAQRSDLTGDVSAHAGTAVTLLLQDNGATARVYEDTTVTGPDGSFVFVDVPASLVGESYRVEASRDDYGAASIDFTVDADAVTVVQPDGQGEPIPLLLPLEQGEFDVCAGAAGPCVAGQFFNTTTVRVSLRDTTDVVEIRTRARVPFLEDDLAPAFVPFDPATNATPVDISGADGLVDVFVQIRRTSGAVEPVLESIVVKDTLPPSLDALEREPAAGAVDARFSSANFVDVVIDADPGAGNVAPLGTARAVVADAPPATPPGGAVPCVHGASCRVNLPGADVGAVEEKLHRVFAFACDAAGNCSNASETFVIHDVTAPAAVNGVAFDITGAGVVDVGNGQFVLPSTLYGASLDVGTARTAGGAAVVDAAGAPVSDVFAYRFSFNETTADALVRALDPSPAAAQSRADLVLPGLPPVDGSYELFAQLVDGAGNATGIAPNPFSVTLTVDTTAPDVAFTLSSGALVVTSPSITFDVDVAAGGEVPSRVDVAADGGLFASGVVSRNFPLNPAGEPFTLPSNGDGRYVVFARVFDAAGNRAERSAQVTLDTTPPDVLVATCRTCVVGAGGALFTSDDLGVIVDVLADDITSLVTDLDVSVNGGAASRDDYDGNVLVPVSLNATNAISIRAVDAAGLVTPGAEAATLSVKHDDLAPTIAAGTVQIDGGAARTRSVDVDVTVGAGASDANGIVGMRLSTSTSFSGAVLTFVSPATFTLAGADGSKQVCVELRDPVGNVSNQCDSIDLDRTAPVGSASIEAGAAVTSKTGPTVNLTFDAGTTGFAVSTSALDCSSTSYTAASGTSAAPTVTFSGADGQRTVFACFQDAAGNTSAASDDIVFDRTAPLSSIAVDGGAGFTVDRDVIVAIAVADGTRMNVAEGTRTLAQCQALASGAFESIASSKALQLAAGADGLRTVSACFEDAALNRSVALDDITLDTALPSASLVVTGTIIGTVGADARAAIASTTLTRTPFVTLTLNGASADAADVMISNDSSFIGEVFEPLVPGNYAHQLVGADGSKSVFVKLRDSAGNQSATLSASITLDTSAPASPTVLVNSGAAFTSDTNARVTLTLGASAGPAQMAFSTSGDFSLPAFESFATTKASFQLTTTPAPAGDGLHTVFAIFRDAAGNESAAVNDGITLDRVAPAPLADVDCDGTNQVVCVNAGASFTNSVSVTVQVTSSVVPPATSEANKATEMQLAVDGAADTEPFIPYAPTVVALLDNVQCLAANPQCKLIAVRFRDAAGNVSAQSTDSIGLDSVRPTAPRIATAPVVTKASTQTVSLSVDASDEHGVTYQLLGGANADWTDTADTDDFVFQLTSPSSASIEQGDVYNLGVRAVDPAGNISGEEFVTITCDGNAPSTPTGFGVGERSGSVSLRWDRPNAADIDVIGYLVRYGYEQNSLTDDFAAEGPSPIFVQLPSGSAAPTITLTGLADDTPFFVTVSAIDHATAPNNAPNESGQTAAAKVLPNEVAPTVIGGLARTQVGSTFGQIVAKGARVYSREDSDVCVYDVSNPRAPSKITCKRDLANFASADSFTVIGRFGYLFRPGASTRVIDVGRLGGSQRNNGAADHGVPVTTLAGATNNVCDMVHIGSTAVDRSPQTLIARDVGATTEVRALQLPAAGNPLAGVYEDAGVAANMIGTDQCFSLDADASLVAAFGRSGSTSDIVSIHLTRALGTAQRLIRPFNTVRDVQIETTSTTTGKLYLGSVAGLEVFNITFAQPPSVPSITVSSAPVELLGGFDCTRMELTAGHVYCTDTSTGTQDSLIVIELEPVLRATGRMLVDNTKVGAGAPSTIAGFDLEENMVYAGLNDTVGSLAAIEIASASRYTAEGASGIQFDDVAVVRNTAALLRITGVQVEAATFDITDFASPSLIIANTGNLGTNCDSGALTKKATGQVWGRVVLATCADGQLLGGNNAPFFPLDPVTGISPSTSRARAGGDVSETRSFVVDGHHAYVVTSDSQVEAWALGHNTAATTITTVGGAVFSRQPAVQDDRVIVVDDAGVVRVLDASNTPTTGVFPVISTLSIGAGDTSRFGDVVVRGGSIVVTRALTNQTLAGIFNVPFNAETGALGPLAQVQSKPRGFGNIAPLGERLMISDGFMIGSPAAPGLVSGIFAIDPANLNIKTSTQAVIAPFGSVAQGHVIITANRDAGLELFTITR